MDSHGQTLNFKFIRQRRRQNGFSRRSRFNEEQQGILKSRSKKVSRSGPAPPFDESDECFCVGILWWLIAYYTYTHIVHVYNPKVSSRVRRFPCDHLTRLFSEPIRPRSSCRVSSRLYCLHGHSGLSFSSHVKSNGITPMAKPNSSPAI